MASKEIRLMAERFRDQYANHVLTEIHESKDHVTLVFPGGHMRWSEPPLQDAHILSWIQNTDEFIVWRDLVAYPVIWEEVGEEDDLDIC